MKDLDRKVADLAAGQHGAFSRRQARGLGASTSACNRRVAAKVWLPTKHVAVFVLAAWVTSWRQRLMAATLAGPEGAVVSHRAAAVLHGVREGEPVELTVRRGANRQRALVHQASVPLGDRTTVAGIPVTRIERTLVDLAAVVEDDEVEQAVEAALRRGLTTTDRLVAPLGATRPGTARLRRVLARRASGRPAGSELEVRLIQLLRAAGMPDPVRQHELRIGDDRYLLDVAYPDRRLCIEADGREAHEGEAFQPDRTRQNALVLAGWTVLRFTWADVAERADQIVALVTRALAA